MLEAQKRLYELGYYNGDFSGVYDEETDRAYKAYLQEKSVELILAPPLAKIWWESKALVGQIAVLIATVLSILGYTLDLPSIELIVTLLFGLAGTIVSIVGSVQRKAPLKW
jgi:hypothetical protein